MEKRENKIKKKGRENEKPVLMDSFFHRV